jgi:hypothetical protein
LGIRALSNDNRTYGFYGATVTVTNAAPLVNLVQSNAEAPAPPRFGFVSIREYGGQLIVVFVRMSAFTDRHDHSSTGNSYVMPFRGADLDGHRCTRYSMRKYQGGANTVTATFSAIAITLGWRSQYSGLNTNPLDRTAHAGNCQSQQRRLLSPPARMSYCLRRGSQ